jgi:hypothetical protein
MPGVDFEAAKQQEEARLQKLHPTPEDISGCMTMFDTFLSCNGEFAPTKLISHLSCRDDLTSIHLPVLGVQLKSLYRFGHMSNCSEKLEDFKFCMSLKSMHPDEKRDVWIKRRAEWWATRRLDKSSENVWDMRT